MAGFMSFIPVILLLAFVGGFAWIGYQMYLYSLTLTSHASDHMQKHNISLSSTGGMKVGVKQMSDEEYQAKTQNVLVDTWNKSSMPDYKSRLWNREAQEGIRAREKEEKAKRPGGSRTSSSAGGKAG